MLEGTLESFTLPDIFQLLAFTKKSGCLNLDSGAQAGRVYFKEGQVYYALSSKGRLALGRRLVGAGLVSTEQLQKALAEQERSAADGRGLRLGQILVKDGAITDETLETFVREQIQDAVFDLMRWTDGAFKFDMGPGAVIDEPIQLSVSVENLIMEGSRRLEEWDAVNKKIPSLKAVVAMAPLPGDSGVEVNLKPEEWRLLTLIDGRRTVGDLVDAFGQGEFHTCKVLYGMTGSGLLEIRDTETEGPPSIAALLTQQDLLRELEGDDASTASETAASPAGDEAAGDEPTSPAGDAAATGEDAEDDTSAAGPIEANVAEPVKDTPENGSGKLKAKVSDPTSEKKRTSGPKQKPEQRLTTDPSIDEDLVRRLIDGVKGL